MTYTLSAPLTKEECRKIDICKELGAARLVLIPHCQDDRTKPIVIDCEDQRDALKLMFGKEYTEALNQCSTTPKYLETSKKLEVQASLGCAATNPSILSALMDAPLVDDELDDDFVSLDIIDSAGKQPKFWETVLEPLEDGQASADWRIHLFYSFFKVENTELAFGVKDVRSLQLNIVGLPHPTLKKRGAIKFNKRLVAV